MIIKNIFLTLVRDFLQKVKFKNQTMNEIIIKNPITNSIRNSILKSKERLNFAFPFLSSFATTILNIETISDIKDKRIITRFDNCSLSSFDLPTLKALLDLGFIIQYDNSIHLKLYIADNDIYITSSNFTKGGFEDNVELTVKTDSNNIKNCTDIFKEIWVNCTNNKVTYELIESKMAIYEVLRKREKYVRKVLNKTYNIPIKVGGLDLQEIINEIFNEINDSSWHRKQVFEADKVRAKTKWKLMQGYNQLFFYAPEEHELRKENLWYDFIYGYEKRLAGTGLRELQFKTVFQHPDFEKVINFIYPEILGMKSWNLNDKNDFQEFCNGIFNFEIPQYKEAIPIRLASYFYPEFFIPIFKIEHLKKICETLGLKTDAGTSGDKLFVYNSFLSEKMKALPFDNYIKSNISYKLLFTMELYNRLSKGEIFQSILDSYHEKWKKDYILGGKDLLVKLNIIKLALVNS